jgi:hypothetical protein
VIQPDPDLLLDIEPDFLPNPDIVPALVLQYYVGPGAGFRRNQQNEMKTVGVLPTRWIDAFIQKY